MSLGFIDNLIKISPYCAGEQPETDKIIKLNANENPYPPSPLVSQAINNYSCSGLKRYPGADCLPLKVELAKRFNSVHGLTLTKDNFFIGNGSDDVLALSFRAFFNSDKPIIFPDVTYSFYTVWCEMFGISYNAFPVGGDFNISVGNFKVDNGGVILANPNAPTAICQSLDFVRSVLEANPNSVVIVDEAYIDFGGESAISLLNEYDNLCVIQTFSKSRSMAGMRLGYACAGKVLIDALSASRDCFNSYPVDSLALEAGCASVADEEYFQSTLAKVIETRERVAFELKKLGFIMTESKTNFLFAEHPLVSAAQIKEFLASSGIYVRHFSGERTNRRLRITIGTDAEMDAMLQALKKMF